MGKHGVLIATPFALYYAFGLGRIKISLSLGMGIYNSQRGSEGWPGSQGQRVCAFSSPLCRSVCQYPCHTCSFSGTISWMLEWNAFLLRNCLGPPVHVGVSLG